MTPEIKSNEVQETLDDFPIDNGDMLWVKKSVRDANGNRVLDETGKPIKNLQDNWEVVDADYVDPRDQKHKVVLKNPNPTVNDELMLVDPWALRSIQQEAEDTLLQAAERARSMTQVDKPSAITETELSEKVEHRSEIDPERLDAIEEDLAEKAVENTTEIAEGDVDIDALNLQIAKGIAQQLEHNFDGNEQVVALYKAQIEKLNQDVTELQELKKYISEPGAFAQRAHTLVAKLFDNRYAIKTIGEQQLGDIYRGIDTLRLDLGEGVRDAPDDSELEETLKGIRADLDPLWKVQSRARAFESITQDSAHSINIVASELERMLLQVNRGEATPDDIDQLIYRLEVVVKQLKTDEDNFEDIDVVIKTGINRTRAVYAKLSDK